MNTLVKLLLTALIVFGLSKLSIGVHINSYWTAFVFSLVLSLLNFFIKPILIILTIPATILSLGLFLFVINACCVWLASGMVSGIEIDGFGSALLFSLILSVISFFLYSKKKDA